MFDGKLNEFCNVVNQDVTERGFWNDMSESVSVLLNAGVSNELSNAVNKAFISQKIALIISECSEALEAIRKDSYGLEQKDTFEDEIADTIIRLCDLCGALDIDIEKQISWKMRYNKNREHKHGKKF